MPFVDVETYDSPGVVCRREAVLVRLGPDLEEMHLFPASRQLCQEEPQAKSDSRLVVVVLAVGDTGPAARHLHVAALHRLDVAHVVLVRQLAGDDVREDLELAVRVRGEAGAGLGSAWVENVPSFVALCRDLGTCMWGGMKEHSRRLGPR